MHERVTEIARMRTNKTIVVRAIDQQIFNKSMVYKDAERRARCVQTRRRASPSLFFPDMYNNSPVKSKANLARAVIQSRTCMTGYASGRRI